MAPVTRITALRNLFNRCVLNVKVPNVHSRQFGNQMAQSIEYPSALYGGRHTVSLLSGDGIGPEMTTYVREIFLAARVPVEFEDVKLDQNHNDEIDFERALLSIKRNGIALKGSIESEYSDPLFERSRNAMMRVRLDLFVNILHAKTYHNTRGRPNLDIAVIRQNTGGEYSMKEHETVPGVVESLKIITRNDAEKLGAFAFNFARTNNRKKITCVHKANIQKLSDGLFLETMEKVAARNTDIDFSSMIVDNTCMQLAMNPYQFDVIVAPNLYGLVVQNVICGLAGGAGVFGGRNLGDKVSVFEPGTRNTGMNLKSNVGNPLAMINASVDMLNHLKLTSYAKVISNAVTKTVSVDMVHTKDLGGCASSLDVVQSILKNIKEANY